jgi:predicted dehydrogenase
LIQQLSANQQTADCLSVGILGYAPSVGELHGRGVDATAGLSLKAICDLNPNQLEIASHCFPDAVLYESADRLISDSSIDLVIIATPPNTHAALSIQMMNAGKHVVCEKPLAINRRETDRMRKTADGMKVHLSCHQNRRFDQDYLAIQETVSEGLIGDLFYMETFVGGFYHPCGHWHSHAPISGGTAYDWGAHYLDWIVGLIPEKVAYVSSTSQKRVWLDISNADHEQIQIKFENKAEAFFIHSDIAAIRKPKWYLLGTKGAIAGYWQDVTTFEHDRLLYYEQHDIPATEMPPDLRLNIRHPGGKIVEQKITPPVREAYPFHKNIADHLIFGEPLGAPLEDSIKVVAILEAASISAANGGKPEMIK